MQMMPLYRCAEGGREYFPHTHRFSLRQEAELFHCWIIPSPLPKVTKGIDTQGFDLNF